MALRQREWARRIRRRLRAALGYKCAKCGKRRDTEFDCIVPRGDHHHNMEWSWRMSFYRQQHAQGNLQLLCKRCHGSKSCRESMAAIAAMYARSRMIGVNVNV